MADRGSRVAFRTLGCKVNQVESEAIAAELLGEGWTIAAEDEADVVVVNTCTVTGEADRKARKVVRGALASERRPLVVVTGCLAGVDAEAVRALGQQVVVEPDKGRVAAVIAEALRRADPAGPLAGETPDTAPRTRAESRPSGRRSRVAVKVEDGCDVFCAYCIVPHARGVPRSVPIGEVMERIASLVADGVAEVVLTGINIGRYQDAGRDLGDLVRAVGTTGVRRIRLSSVEPQHLDESALEAFSAVPAFMPHLHVPLQSGSDAVLERMGRRYDTAGFERIVELARAALPGLALTTDVIAGFPGETAEDAAETLAFVERARLDRLHVFRYSMRAGTPAATMPGHVSPAEKARRAAALRELDGMLRAAHADRRLGGEAAVLVEVVDDGVVEGTAEDYLRVRAEAPGARPGDVLRVRLVSAGGDGVVTGSIVEPGGSGDGAAW